MIRDGRKVYLATISSIILVLMLVVFFVRAWEMTKGVVSDDYAITISQNVTAGTVYDRNGKVIVYGTEPNKYEYEKEYSESSANLIGPMNLMLSFDSSYTVAGKKSDLLYGLKQNHMNSFVPGDRIGGDLYLTIDIDLQDKLYSELRSEGWDSAAAIVTDYENGEILAAVSYPSYKDIGQLKKDSNGVLNDEASINKVFRDSQMLGSVVKPFLYAAVLEQNPEMKSAEYTCDDSHHVFDNTPVQCAGGINHGKLNMQKAMEVSCNSYVEQAVSAVDRKKLVEQMHRFGFDESLHFQNSLMFGDCSFIGNDTSDDVAFRLGVIGAKNCCGSLAALAYSYSSLLNEGISTPLQLFLKESDYHGGKPVEIAPEEGTRVCSKETANAVTNMMIGVTESGTTKAIYHDNITIASKSGTAQYDDGETSNLYLVSAIVDDKKPYLIIVTVVADNEHHTSSDLSTFVNYAIDQICDG